MGKKKNPSTPDQKKKKTTSKEYSFEYSVGQNQGQ